MIKWLHKLLHLLAAFLLLATGSLTAAEVIPPKTNLEWLTSVLDSTLTKLVQQQVITAGDTISVTVAANDTAFATFQLIWLREHLLNDYRNVVVIDRMENNISGGKQIQFHWLDWRVRYTPLTRNFWQRRQFQRNLLSNFFVEIFNCADGQLVFSQQFSYQNQDVLSDQEMKWSKQPGYGFTAGIYEQANKNSRHYTTSIFLFAVSGAIIYLFYAIRSR